MTINVVFISFIFYGAFFYKMCYSIKQKETTLIANKLGILKELKTIENKKVKIKRETFSSGIAVFFATLSSAVGLGNIWKFPSMVGTNGGGAFILVYLISVLLVSLPVMISEFYIGRSSRSNTVGAFDKLRAPKFFRIVGYLGVISTSLILFFYSAVAGWVYSYLFRAIRGDFKKLSSIPMDQATEEIVAIFNTTVAGKISPMIWQLIPILFVTIVIIAGVKKGIEKVTKTSMPILFTLIIVTCVLALRLEGASQGINFLLRVDLKAITPGMILAALGLAFFKLSIGVGTMITYGSYITDDNNMIGNAFKVMLSDTLVSVTVGLAIFPAVFTFGLEPTEGPALLFNTIPLVFSRIPFGNLLVIIFFLLTSLAATMSMLSLVEVPVAFLSEEFNVNRKTAVISIMTIAAIVGVLTVHPGSFFGNVQLLGLSFFDLFDYISSNILMPVTGLLIIIFVGYFTSKSALVKELSNNYSLKNNLPIKIFYLLTKYVAPLLILIVFLNSLGLLG